MEALTSEQETYNKLYTRILCLIVEQFHFELQDMEDFAEVVDLRMELVAQDSLSAKALKQLNFLRKEQERKKQAQTSEQKSKATEDEAPAANAKPTDTKKESKEAKEASETESSSSSETESSSSETESSSSSSEEEEEEEETLAASTSALQSAQEEEIQAELRAAEREEDTMAASSNSTELSAQDRRRILRLVLTVVIPDLRKLMVATDEQRNQTVRCGVAVVIIQLLRHLPSKVMEM